MPVGVRSVIRNLLYKCIPCKRCKDKSMSIEPMLLSPDHVTDCSAFEIVGIGLAGPLILKNESNVWMGLFTRAAYRSLYLELVNSNSSNEFLLDDLLLDVATINDIL
ncbi:integrase catalytic domain-containing protein [Nephila pilipes]|uniref:Integrase catalytic domain-containing protein n=1 Tax=Nephila pilipes TaxID=299642 RepID=A0A8X6U5I7_NEPPI|nr:integrase catalytic domain-containing protein [Nephila pilipes]